MAEVGKGGARVTINATGLERLAKWMMMRGDVMYPSSRVVYSLVGRMERPRPGTTLLDVGCCFGVGTAILREAGFTTTGVDVDLCALQMARGLYPWGEWYQWDISKALFSRHYDVVTCFETIEHVVDYESLLRNMLTMCKRRLYLTTPNLALSSGRNPEHVREWEIDEMRHLLERMPSVASLQVLDPTTGLAAEDACFVPLYVLTKKGDLP